MPENSESAAKSQLNSWKEIALFFERDVTTVQRWEKEEGLPVHRHLHHRKSSVYAFTEKLEKWWRERGEKLSVEPAPAAPSRSLAWLRWGAVPLAASVLGVIAWMGFSPRNPRQDAPRFQTTSLRETRPDAYLTDALMGDVNGDGRDDLVVSTLESGEIYILLSGQFPAGDVLLPEAARVIIRIKEQPGALSALQIADFNGDGVKDILATGWGELKSFRGTPPSYILWGRRQWPTHLTLPDMADVKLWIDWPNQAGLGACSPRGGDSDLNGDGIQDVILGAHEYSPQGRRSAGGLFVLFGRKKWPRDLEVQSAADIIIQGSRMGEALGTSCAVGDFNGDGHSDLAVGAAEHTLWNLLGSRGRAYVFLGREKWPRVLDAQDSFDFRVDGTKAGKPNTSVVFADLNADGRDDLIVGRAPFAEDAADYPGEVSIWFGGPSRLGIASTGSVDVTIAGNAPGAYFAHAMKADDLDGDGMQDLVISEPGTGQVLLLYGRREWKKSGRLQDYAPVKLFQGEGGAGYGPISLGDTDGNGLLELFFTGAWKTHYNQKLRESHGRAWLLKTQLPVKLDVRPYYEPNVVYFPGLVVVQVHGFSRADVDQIEPASVRLAGVAPQRHVEGDYNGDSISDLQLYFETATMPLTADTKQITLTARTCGGLPVAGTDKIVVFPAGQQSAGSTRPSSVPARH